MAQNGTEWQKIGKEGQIIIYIYRNKAQNGIERYSMIYLIENKAQNGKEQTPKSTKWYRITSKRNRMAQNRQRMAQNN